MRLGIEWWAAVVGGGTIGQCGLAGGLQLAAGPDVADPGEGLTAGGQIRTGADRRRIPAPFIAVVDGAVARIHAVVPTASVYLYGSVATGVARPPQSDVDLLTIGLPVDRAEAISERLSHEHAAMCRGVEIAASVESDFLGEHDEAYGGRVFLHHYCVHLAGPDLDRATSGFPGDRRAARGFNGDIDRHAARWRQRLDDTDPVHLGRVVGRKTLLAVAGLVSVNDRTWTTDRERAATRWGQVHPELADGLAELRDWTNGLTTARHQGLAFRLDNTVDRIVDQFAVLIGLWGT